MTLNMKKYLISYIGEYLLSNKRLIKNRQKVEKIRKSRNLPHSLEVFIAINDPSSYLLLQVLHEFKQRYNLTLTFNTVLHKQDDMYPEPKRWKNNVFNDSVRMAELYQLDSPQHYALDEDQTLALSLLLTELEQSPTFLTQATEIFDAVWQNKSPIIAQLIKNQESAKQQQYKDKLNTNEQALLAKGHYLTGTIEYGGEWYWGLERLQYVEQRLNELNSFTPQVIKYNKLHDLYQPLENQINDKQVEDPPSPLTVYFSIRSPYSYLGLLRAIKLSEHYQIPLELKPVLPMLMRGMKVPKKKGMYIVLDTKREANSYGIEFGKIADPLGAGVERCYAVFEYAKSLGKEVEFMKNYATAVWSQRIFSDTNQGLKKIVEISGLDWQVAQPLLNDESWRKWADANLKELFDLGLWGVPCFKYKDTHVFGQDKLLFIEQAIRNDN